MRLAIGGAEFRASAARWLRSVTTIQMDGSASWWVAFYGERGRGPKRRLFHVADLDWSADLDLVDPRCDAGRAWLAERMMSGPLAAGEWEVLP